MQRSEPVFIIMTLITYVDSTLAAQKLKLSHLGSIRKVQEEIMMKWRRKNSMRITLEGS